MESASEAFIESLSKDGRVVLLGGLAVIAHGLSRATKDIDVWLDPLGDVTEWTGVVRRVLSKYDQAKPYNLRRKRVVECEQMEEVIARDSVIRIVGLDRPIDIFRIPHNFTAEDFDEVWEHTEKAIGGARLPDEIDLLVTKEGTSRHQDIADASFLEDKIRSRLCETLQTCAFPEAEAAFQRYVDHETCRAALGNPHADVRELALATLRQFAADGDPFAREILDGYAPTSPES